MAEQDTITRKKLGSSWFSTVLSIALVLTMVGLLGVILINARRITMETKENISFEVILQPDIKQGDIIDLRNELKKHPYVKSYSFISKEQAARETIALLGHDFREVVGDILPPSIILKIKAEYASVQYLQKLEKTMQMDPRVFDVQYQKTYVENINKNLSTISLVMLCINAVLLIIAISLLINTIRLSIYANRFLIRSMLYVGAKRSTIRRPFIIKGICQGFFGALFAMIVISLCIYFGNKYSPIGGYSLIGMDTETMKYYGILYVFILCISILFTWFSTFMAVRKYIRMKIDNLYF